MPTLDSGQTPADAINQIYQSVLRREADPSGLSLWEAQFNAGFSLDSIRDSLVVSSEATRFVDPIIRLYEVAFGRQPDDAGLTFFVNAFRDGASLESIALGFTGSQEFINRFGTSTDRSAFVESLYVNGLGRASDAGGKAFWVGSDFTDEQLLLGFSESPESIARLDDATTIFLINVSEGIAADTSDSLTTITVIGGFESDIINIDDDIDENVIVTVIDEPEPVPEPEPEPDPVPEPEPEPEPPPPEEPIVDEPAPPKEPVVYEEDQPGYFLIDSADADKLTGLGRDDIQLDIDDSVTLIGVTLGDFNSGDVLF